MTTSMRLGKVSRRKWCGVEHLLTGHDMVCNSLFLILGRWTHKLLVMFQFNKCATIWHHSFTMSTCLQLTHKRWCVLLCWSGGRSGCGVKLAWVTSRASKAFQLYIMLCSAKELSICLCLPSWHVACIRCLLLAFVVTVFVHPPFLPVLCWTMVLHKLKVTKDEANKTTSKIKRSNNQLKKNCGKKKTDAELAAPSVSIGRSMKSGMCDAARKQVLAGGKNQRGL